jgi:hypothetical protein
MLHQQLNSMANKKFMALCLLFAGLFSGSGICVGTDAIVLASSCITEIFMTGIRESPPSPLLPERGSVEHTRPESAGRIGVTSPFGPAARSRLWRTSFFFFSCVPLGGLSLDEVFSSESELESGFLFKACKPTLICYLCNTLQHLPILHQDTCCP